MMIWHISDTHGLHEQLVQPKRRMDMVVFSGDCSNYKDPYRNEHEVREFISWFGKLDIPHKVMVAGNHDTSIERRLVTREYIESMGITYLEHEHTTINGIKMFGSPYTPTYGEWAFMKRRDKLHDMWGMIEEDTNVIIVHGPPKGMLDLSYSRDNNLEMCGCNALKKKIAGLSKLDAVLFGHIHDNREGIINQGIRINNGIRFSNASCVTDGRFNLLSSHGNIIELL